jgi:hypothetical protein
MSIWLGICLIAYLIINYKWSKSIYNSSIKYYQDKEVNDNNPVKNLHERYSVFRRYDKLSFWKIFFGMCLMFWWRMALAIGVSALYGLLLK